MALYGNTFLTGKELFFDESDVIVSKTDLKGKITYGNRIFLQLSQMGEAEVLGQPHNIIRHPEMPRCVYHFLWQEVQNKREIFAYVNNRAKSGDHYWVFAHVTPSFDSNGEVTNYHSNRRVPKRSVLDEIIIPLYKELLALEKSFDSPKDGLEASVKKVMSILDENKMTFNEYMFSLNV